MMKSRLKENLQLFAHIYPQFIVEPSLAERVRPQPNSTAFMLPCHVKLDQLEPSGHLDDTA